MNKFLKAGLILALLAGSPILAGCDKLHVGEVGIMTHSMGSDAGIDPTPKTEIGYYWTGWSGALHTFPTYTANYTWTKDITEGNPKDESISFNDNNGVGINADIGISYHVDPKKAIVLFQKYKTDIDVITNTFIRNNVRDSLNEVASQYPVEYIYGKGRPQLINEVKARVQKQVASEGLVIENLYWIGTPRLPKTIQDAINAKMVSVQQAQQRENEVAKATAQAQIEVATAKGDQQAAEIRAESNVIVAKSLTPELVELKRIELAREIFTGDHSKWKGNLPQVITSSNGSSNIFDLSKMLK